MQNHGPQQSEFKFNISNTNPFSNITNNNNISNSIPIIFLF